MACEIVSPEGIFNGRRVFFSAPRTILHPNPDLICELIDYMTNNRAHVLSKYVGESDQGKFISEFIKTTGVSREPKDFETLIYEANISLVDECTNFIAIDPVAGDGTLMLMQHALDKHKMQMKKTPALCLYNSGHDMGKVSNIVKGTKTIQTYEDVEDAKRIITKFLTTFS